MLKDIVEVRHLGGHRLYLRFEDGVAGDLDIADFTAFEGIFEPLREIEYFAKVALHESLGTIYWPNGADLDPDVLYARVKGEAIPDLETETTAA